MTEGRPQQSKDRETQILGMFHYNILEVWGVSGARPLALWACLTSSFVPFGRSGRVTNAMVQSSNKLGKSSAPPYMRQLQKGHCIFSERSVQELFDFTFGIWQG